MKYKKIVKNFYFQRDKEEIIRELDPITLKKHGNLLDSVYNRYPLISKIELAVIITTIFEVLRELLIRGCVLNINRFFFDFKLHFFQHNTNKTKTNNAVKVKIKTPPSWKERPSWKSYQKRIKI